MCGVCGCGKSTNLPYIQNLKGCDVFIGLIYFKQFHIHISTYPQILKYLKSKEWNTQRRCEKSRWIHYFCRPVWTQIDEHIPLNALHQKPRLIQSKKQQHVPHYFTPEDTIDSIKNQQYAPHYFTPEATSKRIDELEQLTGSRIPRIPIYTRKHE